MLRMSPSYVEDISSSLCGCLFAFFLTPLTPSRQERGALTSPKAPFFQKKGDATAPLVALSLGYSGIHKPSYLFLWLAPLLFFHCFGLWFILVMRSAFPRLCHYSDSLFLTSCLGSAPPLPGLAFLLASSLVMACLSFTYGFSPSYLWFELSWSIFWSFLCFLSLFLPWSVLRLGFGEGLDYIGFENFLSVLTISGSRLAATLRTKGLRSSVMDKVSPSHVMMPSSCMSCKMLGSRWQASLTS
jgi:hypothetical protein